MATVKRSYGQYCGFARALELVGERWALLIVRGLLIGPKRFGKIARFQAALDAKIRFPRRTWLSIAHALGYHDQMHMVHDFRQFGSASPKSVFSMLGDGRPPALAAATQLERRSS